ncbi:MAG: D-glycero-alpha-D-manno-heptose 1-phosphate guanylyltransferase [Ignavibacteria bacterium ADurb.Bin266]|nr:MAG: D-glycero-alpha-D-manno-heptose 1-phosphate guanylyltransferase [Ignavibacteria bacterium ADurb.Bin266]
MRAVILAGGQGTRLRPYTTLIPKPLVPIGNEMPILEVIIKQLVNSGFDHITLTVNHLSNLIMAFFGDGSKWNIKLDYSLEDKPLSTIGPLTLINDLPDDFLVMNGDILCDLNYGDFYNHHISNQNKVTVSTYKRDSKIDFGVLKFDENNIVKEFIEKPVYNFDVSMGIYCINKSVIDNIPKGEKYGFDNLMIDGIKNSSNYSVKPFSGFWLDIGRPEDYDYCNENYEEIKKKLQLS